MFKRFTPVTHSNIWTRPRGPRSAARFIGTSVIGVMRQGPVPHRCSLLLSLLLSSFLPSYDSTEKNDPFLPSPSVPFPLSPLISLSREPSFIRRRVHRFVLVFENERERGNSFLFKFVIKFKALSPRGSSTKNSNKNSTRTRKRIIRPYERISSSRFKARSYYTRGITIIVFSAVIRHH